MKKIILHLSQKLVRTNGIEPSRCHHHRLLRPARLPVPPRPRRNFDNTNLRRKVQEVTGFYILEVMENERTENHLRENLSDVRRKIEDAARKVGRSADEIKLIAVSKTHPVETVRKAIAEGAVVFGENKVQEAEDKIFEIGRENVEWHLIGHLQSNKARKAVKLFDVIHTLDSIELAERLERICIEENVESLSVLIQVDIAGEETKSGASVKDLPALVDFTQSCERLKLIGLMILPPFYEDAEQTRPYFRKLREIRDEFLPGGELSMGMSHDFETAIEEGATIVRVGTAIFGAR
jgi:pyridoxal phosphate enzyme (YggS family)